MALPAPVGYLYWYTTSAVLLVLTILNFTHQAIRYVERRGGLERLSSSRIGRCLSGGKMVLQKYIFLTSLSIPPLMFWKKKSRWRDLPLIEIWWRVVYTVGFLVLSFYGTKLDTLTYANQAAWVAVAQVPLIIALAGKNNLISFLTGIPYDRLNYIHRAAGQLCLLGVWIHAGGHWYVTHGWSYTSFEHSIAHWGLTGLLAITLLSLLSLAGFRRYWFEFFLVSHVLLVALMLAAFIMHWKKMDVWIYPGVGLWGLEKLLRAGQVIINNHIYPFRRSRRCSKGPDSNLQNIKAYTTASVSLLTPSTLLLTFPRPSLRIKWGAGQHFYVMVPGISRWPWEEHPFTTCTVPMMTSTDGNEGGELAFIIRVRDGFTKKLKKYVEKKLDEDNGKGEGVIHIRAGVEGPYGAQSDIDNYDGVLMFVGGSGVSFAVAHLLQIIRNVRDGKSRVKNVNIVWMVTSRLHLDWITPLLSPHLPNLPPSLNVTITIHTTRAIIPLATLPPSPLPDLSASPAEAQNELSAYLERKMDGHSREKKEKRRRSRWSILTWASWTGRRHRESGVRRQSDIHFAGQAEQKAESSDAPHRDGPEAYSRRGSTAPASSVGSSPRFPHQEMATNFAWSEGYSGNNMPSGQTRNDAVHHIPPDSSNAMMEARRGSTMPPVLEENSDISDGSSAPSSNPETPMRIPTEHLSPGQEWSNSRGEPRVARPSSEWKRKVSISDEPPTVFVSARRASAPMPSGHRPSILLPSLVPRMSIYAKPRYEPEPVRIDPVLLTSAPMSRSSSGSSTNSVNSGMSQASFSLPSAAPTLTSLFVVPDGGSVESGDAEISRPSTPKVLLDQFISHAGMEKEDILQGATLLSSIQDSRKKKESLEAWMGEVETEMQRRDSVALGLTPRQSEMEEKENIHQQEDSGVVVWKTGRADLQGCLREMIEKVSVPIAVPGEGDLRCSDETDQTFRDRRRLDQAVDLEAGCMEKGGKVWVGVCGPSSLLASSKEAVRKAIGQKAMWKQGVVVDFHAESFGS